MKIEDEADETCKKKHREHADNNYIILIILMTMITIITMITTDADGDFDAGFAGDCGVGHDRQGDLAIGRSHAGTAI